MLSVIDRVTIFLFKIPALDASEGRQLDDRRRSAVVSLLQALAKDKHRLIHVELG